MKAILDLAWLGFWLGFCLVQLGLALAVGGADDAERQRGAGEDADEADGGGPEFEVAGGAMLPLSRRPRGGRGQPDRAPISADHVVPPFPLPRRWNAERS